MKRMIIVCLLVLTSGIAGASQVIGVFKTPDSCAFTVYLSEILPPGNVRKPLKQELNVGVKNNFVMNLANQQAGFYTLSIVVEKGKSKTAYNEVIYLKPSEKLSMEFESGDNLWLKCNYEKITSADNKALAGLNDRFNALFRTLYNDKTTLAGQRAALDGLYVLTNSVLKNKGISQAVQQYLKFKAFDAYNTNLYRLALDGSRGGKQSGGLGADFYKQPVDPLVYFNDPVILLFPYAVSNLMRYLEVSTGMPVYKSRKTLEEINKQIALLKTKVTQQILIDEVIARMLDGYVTNYSVGGNFEEDLKAYAAVANQIHQLKTRVMVKQKFENLRYTMKGAAWPDLKFENAEGKPVSLDQFKGKYLFIDLWASWCVPCIKMTTYVQQLEKEYAGKNISFVAISIDGNKQDWLKKLKELTLHGHQYLDLSSAFAKALNVSGIPHYLIYDMEGKLLMYKAEMPNDPNLKQKINRLPGL